MRLNYNTDDKDEFELPSLIDMVFLLLIFFMASLSVSSSGDPSLNPGQPQRTFNLPEAKGEVSVLTGEEIKALIFQIEHKDAKDTLSPKVVYILWPEKKQKVTEDQALEKVQSELSKAPSDSSHFATFPGNFLQIEKSFLDTCRVFSLIAENIKKYKEYLGQQSSSNTIEIRAVKETEFRIINFVMDQCSLYDKFFPKITFRVLSSEKAEEVGTIGI